VRGQKEGGDLPLRTMGSLSVVQQLLDAGLVDRLVRLEYAPTGRPIP
jgi:hypothetical protein